MSTYNDNIIKWMPFPLDPFFYIEYMLECISRELIFTHGKHSRGQGEKGQLFPRWHLRISALL